MFLEKKNYLPVHFEAQSSHNLSFFPCPGLFLSSMCPTSPADLLSRPRKKTRTITLNNYKTLENFLKGHSKGGDSTPHLIF